MFAALSGAFLAAGFLLLLRGAFPQRTDLAARLATFSDGSVSIIADDKLFDFYSLKLLETVKGDRLEAFESDVLVTGSDLPAAAVNKARSALLGGTGVAAITVMMGIVGSPIGLLIALALGGALAYAYPDFKLKKEAKARRIEFSQTLTGFMTLLSSSISRRWWVDHGYRRRCRDGRWLGIRLHPTGSRSGSARRQ